MLVVDAPESHQIERLVARDKVSQDHAAAALRAQATRAARLAIADDVIVNTGSIADLQSQVAVLHERYVDLAQRKRGHAPRPLSRSVRFGGGQNRCARVVPPNRHTAQ